MYCTEVVARTNNSLGLTAFLGPAFLGLSVVLLGWRRMGRPRPVVVASFAFFVCIIIGRTDLINGAACANSLTAFLFFVNINKRWL